MAQPDREFSDGKTKATRWLPLILLLLPPLTIFAPVLLHDRSLAFRDTAVFYYPLFQWIEEQWTTGELPLWNPHVNFGTPVVGDASSSMFYPGKVLFLLPIEFSWNFKLYVVGHVFLAAGAAYYAARRFGTSREAAALAAISYACGGSVLFQYCNVVYLVGAAWLPLAFAAVETMLVHRSTSGAVALGVVLAMMVLGGDPQMAYHTGLAAGGYALGLWWVNRKESAGEITGAGHSPWRGAKQLLGLLALSAACAIVLSAVQILPALEASRESDRAAYHAPRSVYEATHVIATSGDGWALASQGLFGEPETGTHSASIYQFSFGPWHLLEYLAPGCYGKYFPQYRRWIMGLPIEPRMWTSSAYLGLLPIVLAVASLRLRRGAVREQWLSWCAVLAVVGSFGAFGIGWLLRLPLHGLGQDDLAARLPSDQIGGLYWFFVTFLPGYAYFRFPAKLLTFAAWPICLLAALGLDRLRREDMPRVRFFLAVAVVVSAMLAAALLVGRQAFDNLATRVASDPAFGPFDKEGAFRDLLVSLVHTSLVAGLLFMLMLRRQWMTSRQGAFTLVAITAVELVVANASMIATAPSSIWRERPLLVEMLEKDRRQRGNDSIPLRVRPLVSDEIIDPAGWHATSSPQRIEELAAADRHKMQTNHCLAGPIDSVESLSSLRLADYTYFYQRHHKNEESFWGNYWVMPRSVSSIGSPGDANSWQPLDSSPLASMARIKLFSHQQPFPRAWIVHDVNVLPELKTRDPHALSLRGAEVVEVDSGEASKRRDFRTEAVVESNNPLFPAPVIPADEAGEMCRIIVDEPNRVVVEVNLAAPGLLVLQDTYQRGWNASHYSLAISAREGLPILRTNRMFRGVLLEAGKDQVVFEYRPASIYLGAWISGLGWIALVVFGIRRLPTLGWRNYA